LLYSNKNIDSLWKPFDISPARKPTVESWTDPDGVVKVRGNSQLKATQSYPAQFGVAVADFYVNSMGAVAEGYSLADLDRLACDTVDRWDDARLSDVLRDLSALP
jgi:hypothetical protein